MHNKGETQSHTALLAKPTLKLPSKEVVPFFSSHFTLLKTAN